MMWQTDRATHAGLWLVVVAEEVEGKSRERETGEEDGGNREWVHVGAASSPKAAAGR